MQAPITAAIDAEDARKQKLKEDADRVRAERANRASTTISAIRDRIAMAVGQTPATILELIGVAEAIEATEEDYGDRTGEVLRVKSETLAKLREMHSAQVQWEKTQAEAREKDRKDKLQSKINALGLIAVQVIGKPSAAVQQAIADLEAMDITAETFAERASDAIDAQQAVLKQLDTLLTAAKAAEAAAATQAAADKLAADAKAETERLDRQRQEQAAEAQRQTVEAQRQETERAALAQQQQQVEQQRQSVASSRTEQIAGAIAALENLPASYSAAMSSEVLGDTLTALRERKIGVAEFGGRLGPARAAHASAIEKIEAMRAEAIRRECAESEMDAAALPPAAPPAPAAAPVAPASDTAQFFGMFNTPAEAPVAAPEPAPAPGAASLLDNMRAALEGMNDIVRQSDGVIGFHKDGTVAEWDEFEEVTRMQMALKAFADSAEPAPF